MDKKAGDTINEAILSLLEAHYRHDEASFRNAALRIAEQETRNGRSSNAREIREYIERVTKIKYVPSKTGKAGASENREETFARDFIFTTKPKYKKEDMVLSTAIHNKLDTILLEYQQRETLQKHGLANKRKILLVGPPGTGKTMSASILAAGMKLPLQVIQTDKIINRYLGETSTRLRQVFEHIQSNHGIYLFDEFDAIGASRMNDHGIGEMRRLVNTLLQFLEQEDTSSIVLAATNHPLMLDSAMYRRFDDTIGYELPDRMEIALLIQKRMQGYMTKLDQAAIPLSDYIGLSHAEITKACEDAIKKTILRNGIQVSPNDLIECLNNRREMKLK